MSTTTQPKTDDLLLENQQRINAMRLKSLYSPRGVFKGTREEWLEIVGDILGGWIDEVMNTKDNYGKIGRIANTPMSFKQYLSNAYGAKANSYTYKAQTIRYSCSLLGSGMTEGNALAHVQFKHSTGNNYDEIRMGVQLGGRKLKLDSCRVADIVLHEIIHTLCPRAGHRGEFRAIALRMGLAGKMTATYASEDLAKRIKVEIIDIIGKYPHQAVHLVPRGKRGKGSRSIKCQCVNVECLFVMRTTQKWISLATDGLHCPICTTDMIHQGQTKGEEE